MGFVPLSINWGGIESGIFSGIVEVDGLDFCLRESVGRAKPPKNHPKVDWFSRL